VTDPVFPILLSRNGGSQLLLAFRRFEVDFLVVGGTAMAFHGLRPLTEVADLDLLMNPSEGNTEQLCNALADLGLRQESERGLQQARFNRHIQLKTQTYFCDLLTPSSSAEYEMMAADFAELSFEGQDLHVAHPRTLLRLLERARDSGDLGERKTNDLLCLEGHLKS
jgi:hypothetical protein